MRDQFTDIELNRKTLDRFYIRSSIFEALKAALPSLSGKLLDAGCGKMPYRRYILENSSVTEYVGLDIESALVYEEDVKPDFYWDGVQMPFENEQFDSVIATEVLEHCPDPEVILKEINRVLKPGGYFFFTVPFLWNLHEVPHDEYRYTPFALERHLKNSGFSEIEIKATGGWHASMAQMLGLWVRRSPMTDRKRKLLSRILLPVVRKLIKKDNAKNVEFKEGQMITGLTGLVKK